MVIGLAVSCGRLDLGLVGVICIYATAVLTSIRAKMIGEFALSSFGPTEFKSLLVLYGIAITALAGGLMPAVSPRAVAFWFFVALIVVGIVQLLVKLVRAVHQVNIHGAPPDTTEWEITSKPSGAPDPD